MERNVFGISEADVHSRAELILYKQTDYLRYIKEHIANVKKAFEEMYSNNYLHSTSNADILEALEKLKDRIQFHDDSKYSDDEFEAYRKQYFPIDDKENEFNHDDYENACEHHYYKNSHHPEHYVINGQPTDMPLIDILEMLCDWDSFKYINKGSAKEYWNSKEGEEKKKIMTPKTIATVSRVINMMDE